jgi:hypothetical protein
MSSTSTCPMCRRMGSSALRYLRWAVPWKYLAPFNLPRYNPSPRKPANLVVGFVPEIGCCTAIWKTSQSRDNGCRCASRSRGLSSIPYPGIAQVLRLFPSSSVSTTSVAKHVRRFAKPPKENIKTTYYILEKPFLPRRKTLIQVPASAGGIGVCMQFLNRNGNSDMAAHRAPPLRIPGITAVPAINAAMIAIIAEGFGRNYVTELGTGAGMGI